jgi:hypothetical protein
LTPYQLRNRFLALHHDVYIGRETPLDPLMRAKACWLRSRRRGVLAEFSASALHGARWIDPARPAAIIDSNRRAAVGVHVREERIEEDEICVLGGMRVTTPARTAIDLARRYPLDLAVAAIDALGQAVELKPVDVELLIDRYRGRRPRSQCATTGDMSTRISTWVCRRPPVRDPAARPRGVGSPSVTPARDSWPKATVALRSRRQQRQAGSRRLSSSAANAAAARISAPRRSQPTLASPRMVS